MAKLINCKGCGKEVSKSAQTCPHCGEPVMLKEKRIGGLIGLALLVLFLIWFVVSSKG